MKIFLKKLLAFFLLPSILAAYAILGDPFKVWFDYDDYYKDYAVTLNRELVCLRLYDKNRNVEDYDSFIFGSSRSQAFKTDKWMTYLSGQCRPFHFDASNEGIYGILNKLRYIDKHGGRIENALMVIDIGTLRTNVNRKGHLYISPVGLSNESVAEFYKEFVHASFNIKFLLAYMDYHIFKTHRPYMGWLISKMIPLGDSISGDVWYDSWDKSIRKDSVAYYSRLMLEGELFDRKLRDKPNYSGHEISESEKKQLHEIKEVLDLHETDCKIVISPLYDQVPMDRVRVDLLIDIFGSKSVYDFSGVNELTQLAGNYYESSHYRPHVAERIMEEIYK